MSDTLNIPFKLVNELPVSNSSSFDIIAVVNNKDAVRVSWNSLTSANVSQTENVPTEPGLTSGIPYITFAADNTGLYVNDGNFWRKSPIYNNHWEDLTEDTRFLTVNSPMTLSENEISNVRQSLDIGQADADKLGLVKVSHLTADSVSADVVRIGENGNVFVEFATPISEEAPDGVPGVVRLKNYYSTELTGNGTYAVTEKYVRDAFTNYAQTTTLPIATTESLGVVKVEAGTALTVSEVGTLSVKVASSENAGVVFIDEETDIDTTVASHAASVGLVDKIVDNKVNELANTKAGVGLGLVRVPGSSAVTIDGEGNIDVRIATETDPGAVTVLGELNTTPGAYSNATTGSTAVTPQAVTDYVQYKLDNLSQSLPIATTETLGAVRAGSSVIVDQEGVLELANATPTRLGGVYVALASNETTGAKVPTEGRVMELVNSGSSKVAPADVNRYGTVRLGTATVIDKSVGTPVGVDFNGQLFVPLQDKNISVDLATSVTSGTVILSSDNSALSESVSSMAGLPIGRSQAGKIYLDATSPYSQATTVRPGLVKLSVSSDTVLDSSNPAIGMDAEGRLRVQSSSGSGGSSSDTSVWQVYQISQSEATNGGFANIYYYQRDGEPYKYPIVKNATSGTPGVVMLGSSSVITDGVPVGLDESGRLAAAVSISSGGEGESFTVNPATVNVAGIVKLSSSSVIESGALIGVNANGQLVADVSIGSSGEAVLLPAATTSSLGAVKLSYASELHTDKFAKIGKTSDSQIGVPVATSSTYGAVKVSGDLYSPDDLYTRVGTDQYGALVVPKVTTPTSTGEGGAPFHVSLTTVSNNPKTYQVTMSGGVVQMNDGSLVNVDPITAEDNMRITPKTGQVLRLQVYMTSSGEPVAKLNLVSTINVLTCKPTLG